MEKFCKTSKSTISCIQPHYRQMLEPMLLNLSTEVSLLRSDAWLCLNLHLERNPTGPNRHDMEISQSFFEHLLKYNTARTANFQNRQPPNPGAVAYNAAIPFNRLPNTTLISRFYLHETVYLFFKPINSLHYGISYNP